MRFINYLTSNTSEDLYYLKMDGELMHMGKSATAHKNKDTQQIINVVESTVSFIKGTGFKQPDITLCTACESYVEGMTKETHRTEKIYNFGKRKSMFIPESSVIVYKDLEIALAEQNAFKGNFTDLFNMYITQGRAAYAGALLKKFWIINNTGSTYYTLLNSKPIEIPFAPMGIRQRFDDGVNDTIVMVDERINLKGEVADSEFETAEILDGAFSEDNIAVLRGSVPIFRDISDANRFLKKYVGIHEYMMYRYENVAYQRFKNGEGFKHVVRDTAIKVGIGVITSGAFYAFIWKNILKAIENNKKNDEEGIIGALSMANNAIPKTNIAGVAASLGVTCTLAIAKLFIRK